MRQSWGEEATKLTAPAKLPCHDLLIGVTGSVGAVAIPVYITRLRQGFAERVHIMMSRASQNFVEPYSLRLLSGNTVFTDSFQMEGEVSVPHINLTRTADLFLILPATANIIGKAAHGICDDLISTSIVACPAPVVFVPSMNEVMWLNPVVQENVAKLRASGRLVIEPVRGFEVSSAKEGIGAMPTFESLVVELRGILSGRPGESRPQEARP